MLFELEEADKHQDDVRFWRCQTERYWPKWGRLLLSRGEGPLEMAGLAVFHTH